MATPFAKVPSLKRTSINNSDSTNTKAPPILPEISRPKLPAPKLPTPLPKLPTAVKLVPPVPKLPQTEVPNFVPPVPKLAQTVVPNLVHPVAKLTQTGMPKIVPPAQKIVPPAQKILHPAGPQILHPAGPQTNRLVIPKPVSIIQRHMPTPIMRKEGTPTIQKNRKTSGNENINRREIEKLPPETIINKLIENKILNLSEEKKKILLGLHYTDGSKIITGERPDITTEIIGMLYSKGSDDENFNNTITFLSSLDSPDMLLWGQESVEEGRIKEAREIRILRAEETGVKGVGTCKYCRSTELTFAMKQLRSGDEPMTTFVRCVMCHKQWRQ